jgi:ketosteroid isomerase-like protein
MDNGELVRSAFEAFLRGDFDALRELMDPGAQWLWYEAGPWDCQGREAVLERLGERVGAITALEDVAAGGELVALEVAGPELAAHLGHAARRRIVVPRP